MNAAEIARNMETDAVAFYKEAAEKTSHPVGKKMFLSIMEDEIKHVKMIEAIIKGMDVDETTLDPMESVKSIFEEMKDQLGDKLTATSDDKEALKIAMDMEKKGFEFYQKAVAEATDDKSKALFEKLVSDEDKHYRIFLNTYNFLNDTGNWFMWEERGMVEG